MRKGMNMDPDGASELDSSCETPENPTTEDPLGSSDHDQIYDQDMEPVVVWVPSGRRIISGLLGLNVVVLGAALVAGQAFNPQGLNHQEPQVFLLVLMGVSLIWMLWYLLWARKKSGVSPHKDHHAGGISVICKFLCLIINADCSQGLLGFSNFFFTLCHSGPCALFCFQPATVHLQDWLFDECDGV